MPKKTIKKIGIFCGSSVGFDPIYAEMSRQLAQQMIKHHIGLVYGGSSIGLMRILADEILAAGLPVIGIMPHFLSRKNIAHQGLTELILTEDMSDRKMMIVERSDALVTLPGGFGTFDELGEVLTLSQLDKIDHPIALYNVKHYYDHLLQQLDTMTAEGFLRTEHRQNIIVDDDPEQLIRKIIDFQPIPVPHKWVDSLKEMTDQVLSR